MYARFSYNVNDLEYSFAGTIEEAIEWTKVYNHWDSCEFNIEDGVLMGEYDSYHGDADEWPEDLEELTHEESTDIEYDGLYYYGNDHRAHPYHGDVLRNCDEEDDDKFRKYWSILIKACEIERDMTDIYVVGRVLNDEKLEEEIKKLRDHIQDFGNFIQSEHQKKFPDLRRDLTTEGEEK